MIAWLSALLYGEIHDSLLMFAVKLYRVRHIPENEKSIIAEIYQKSYCQYERAENVIEDILPDKDTRIDMLYTLETKGWYHMKTYDNSDDLTLEGLGVTKAILEGRL